jgi:hypothetical protein
MVGLDGIAIAKPSRTVAPSAGDALGAAKGAGDAIAAEETVLL